MASSQHLATVHKLVPELRSKQEHVRVKAAKQLFQFVSSDLREVSAEELSAVLDQLTKATLDNVKGDASAKLGGILTIVVLINALDMIDVCKTDTRISRFGNFLGQTCLASSTESDVIELAAKALARLTQVSGTYTANLKIQLVTHEVKRAFENLQTEPGPSLPSGASQDKSELQRGDTKRYASVLVLREIACCMPTFFFQNVSTFYDVIFNAVWDPRSVLRESAVQALRAGLIVTVQREPAKQSKYHHLQWYKNCFTKASSGLRYQEHSESGSSKGQQSKYGQREDKVHGSLLVMAELFRCANASWERVSRELEETVIQPENLPRPGGNARHHAGSAILHELEDSASAGFKSVGLVGAAVKRYYKGGGKATTGGKAGSKVVMAQIPFNWFGSVPAGKEQIVESAMLRHLLSECYEDICRDVLAITQNPNVLKFPHVQAALLQVLPKLAAFQKERFTPKHLTSAMEYMDKLLDSKDRYNAYLGIGLLAMASATNVTPNSGSVEMHPNLLKKVLASIRQNLPQTGLAGPALAAAGGGPLGAGSSSSRDKKQKANNENLPAIFACISMMARSVSRYESVRIELGQMLEPMLSVGLGAIGLSTALTTALYELAVNIPIFKNTIAEGLLKILSLILMHQPFRHPGTPKHLILSSGSSGQGVGQIGVQSGNVQQSTMSPAAVGAAESAASSASAADIVLGLRTLGSFDFEGHSLLQFVRHCADSYLHSEDKSIRLEAVRTCSNLLKGSMMGLAGRKSQTVMSTINEVLAKLLVVGITDQDPDVRCCVMECLDECFDYHLAQAENLSALFVALNDEQFEIRELTMCIIGRLSILNPAHIMPSLRMTLIQLLTEIEHSGVGRNKEQSARILGHLVANAPTLIRPYVDPILSVLIPKLKETDLNPMVITSLLRAIGDLAQVGGKLITKYVDELLPILLEILNDASSLQKREVSLWTLSQLVESTGSVVTPYTRYPNLLDTLLGFLRTEQRPSIRSQTLRLLGLLGALDPYKHKLNIGQIDSAGVQLAPLIPINDSNSEMEQSYDMSPSEMLVNMQSGTLDDFYPSVAIATLMRIIRDPTLFRHHTEVVKAVTFIFKALGIRSVPYIPQVIPSMMNVIRSSDNTFRDFLFQQLGGLISIVQQHIRNYLDDIFGLIKEFWSVDSPLQPTIILLVENIASALGSEFKVYLPQLVPQILRVLMHDSSTERVVTGKLLLALQKFGSTLNDYLHLVLPPIVKLFDSAEVPLVIRRRSLECIDHLTDSLDFSDYVSRIIHPLVRCLDSTPELRNTAMDTLAALVMQLGKKYAIFIPMVHKVLIKQKISHQRYDILCARIMESGSPSDFEDSMMRSFPRRRRADKQDQSASSGQAGASDSGSGGGGGSVRKLPVAIDDLRKAWAVSRRVSKDDWLEWYGGLCRELLKASPSPALRACWTVAQWYSQLAKDLFNASFVSVWSELTCNQQDELMASLEQALTVPDLPEISQTILNLAEFMEHCDKGPLPLDPVLLGEQAMKCRAYAKALHYKEDEFHREPTIPVLESLISINNKLGQKEAASGLLQWGSKNLQGEDMKVQERWYEKLHDWDKALEVYKARAKQKPDDPDLALSQMRCLEALGEWGEVHDMSEKQWDKMNGDTRLKMARMAANAAWGKHEWKAMRRYVNLLPRESQDGAFLRAVLCVHHEQWQEAQALIDMTREMLDTEVTALSLESYQRVYPTMVVVQMLAELEEVIEYKLMPDRRGVIKDMWWQRLQGCQRVVEDWQKIMQVRSLVIGPQEEQRTWLKYASLCRKSGRLQLSHRTLVTILGSDPSHNLDLPLPVRPPKATFAFTKQLWATPGLQEKAFAQLKLFVWSTLQPRCALLTQEAQKDNTLKDEEKECHQLLARCYLKLGQWQESLQGVNDKSIPTILLYYTAATEKDNGWYKAWHAWAVMNFETCLFYRHQKDHNGLLTGAGSSGGSQPQPSSPLPVASAAGNIPSSAGGASPSSASGSASTGLTPQLISTYAVPALKGFVRSIALSKGSSLQDTLRLLTLLFDYGHQSDMYDALHEGLRTIEIDNWLQVIPQLIARIDTSRPLVGRLIHQLLADLGRHHPQALVYPLTVACKSNNAARRNAANKILNKIREHSESLVNQAMMVSEELIRVAILWHEQWHEGLEDASRLYFGERNIPGMLAKLEPLHALLEKGPQTLKETSFVQAYGNELNEAKRWCQRYYSSSNIRELNQAWDLYYQVFRRISRQLPQLIQLELQYVSPKLLVCRDLELVVPGSYSPASELIRIAQVQQSLQVITSKQRPRKLCIRGSNGRTYMFLLKGHEDLRQDERVMQFFSLVNSLLLNDPETFRRNLAIQRFAVIPLSTNSGLIGWVPHSDTLHGLIKDYREKKRILLNIEHKLMQRMTPDYDHLPLMNKVEVFEHSLEHTGGDDLARLLLLKSPSSEVWFDRRANFTRSLAVMSMVGYVLGLGDRHPSNLLLDRMSGKILHIDFGDCFEVAMTREKFPEKIPFRLTRMLINAMEVTGIEGTYRCTCQSVMTVLRNNRDSLMAVLEAFVYDPLLNWRLIETMADRGSQKAKKAKQSQGPTQQSQIASQGAASGEAHPMASALMANTLGADAQSETLTLVADGGLPMAMGDNALMAPAAMETTATSLVATTSSSSANKVQLAQQQQHVPQEALNKKALDIIHRVRDKLTGRDFNPKECLDVARQVDYLIQQATNNENLCQCYIGWCPFW